MPAQSEIAALNGAQSLSKGHQGTLRSPLNRPSRGEPFDPVPGNPGRKRPEDPPDRGRRTGFTLPLSLGESAFHRPVPARYARRAGAVEDPRVRAAGRRMPAVPLTLPPRPHLPHSPATAIVLALVASRPLVLTLIVATFSS